MSLNQSTQVENEARIEIKENRAIIILAEKRKILDKVADELIAQLGARSVDIAKSTALLVLANAIAVYEIEGG